MELGPNQLKWIEELEITEKRQGKGRLHKKEKNVDFYCCLGIGCELFSIKRTSDDLLDYISYLYGRSLNVGSAPIEFIELVKLTEGGMTSLIALNDGGGRSFKEIAQQIRLKPEMYFAETH